MNIYNRPNIIPAGTVLNTTVTSTPMVLQNTLGYNIQVFFTGTPTGTFKLQASSDNSATQTAANQMPSASLKWTDVASSSQAVVAAGNVMWNVMWANYNYVQVVYTDGSSGASTATITSATFNAKG